MGRWQHEVLTEGPATLVGGPSTIPLRGTVPLPIASPRGGSLPAEPLLRARARLAMASNSTDIDRPPSASAVQARQREIAIEHILFHLLRHVEADRPGLIDTIEGSLDHLGDPARDGTADDEAVREIARKLLVSARKEPAA